MVIPRTEDLRSYVVQTERLQYQTNGSAGDNARTFRSRLEQHAAGAVFADQLVRPSAVDKRHPSETFLSCLDCLLDRVRHFLGFTGSETDVSGLVADDDECGERHVLTALYHLGNAVDRD